MLQSRAKNNAMERKATQIFFSSHIMAFLSFGKMRSVLIQEKSNKLLFLKSIKLFLWEASFFVDFKLPCNHGCNLVSFVLCVFYFPWKSDSVHHEIIESCN